MNPLNAYLTQAFHKIFSLCLSTFSSLLCKSKISYSKHAITSSLLFSMYCVCLFRKNILLISCFHFHGFLNLLYHLIN